MISDIGLVALSLAFLFSVYGTLASAYGGMRKRPAWVESSRNASLLVFPLLTISVLVVLYPLMNERKKQPEKAAALKKDGKGRQKEALAAIRDLDFDFQTGKVTREDYETLRSQLVLEAAEYLQTKMEEDEKIEEMICARLRTVKGSV